MARTRCPGPCLSPGGAATQTCRGPQRHGSAAVESVRENRIEAVRIRERRAHAAAEQEAGTA